jgi:thioester reductase-like protein
VAEDEVDCWLLTGSTGLVGRFVLAELLRAKANVATLVRPNAFGTAAQRVEEAITPFEHEQPFGRPRVISFDMGQEGLGISAADGAWLRGKRLAVIHSAASIRFEAETEDGEPYRSNVDGTKHLLSFLRSMSVQSFHYVSTAYVSSSIAARKPGLKCLEDPIDPTTIGRNDYETSKIVAENLVLDCPWIGSRTILRPSIIVGDSHTGYTSTYHGFYAPLKICYQMAEVLGFRPDTGNWFIEQLGLARDDAKNLVPVDWVAKAITTIAGTRPYHNAIYHLTNPVPIRCTEIQQAIQRSLEKRVDHKNGHSFSDTEGQAHQRQPLSPDSFREQLRVYESYFDNDPVFDCEHTQAVLPDNPCPVVDGQLLEKLASYAIDANFGWPRKR